MLCWAVIGHVKVKINISVIMWALEAIYKPAEFVVLLFPGVKPACYYFYYILARFVY